MPRYICKFDHAGQDWYLEWSTVEDAPTTRGMPLAEFKDWYLSQYGACNKHQRILLERMKRVQASGTSALFCTLDEVISCNRAGPGETHLTKEQIVEQYCLQPCEVKPCAP